MKFSLTFCSGEFGDSPTIVGLRDNSKSAHEIKRILETYIDDVSLGPSGILITNPVAVSHAALNQIIDLEPINLQVKTPIGGYADSYVVLPTDDLELTTCSIFCKTSQMPTFPFTNIIGMNYGGSCEVIIDEQYIEIAHLLGYSVKCTKLIPRDKLLTVNEKMILRHLWK